MREILIFLLKYLKKEKYKEFILMKRGGGRGKNK
jgi:hypothetical protein